MPVSISRENNFNLIRLLAAFQVLLWHAHEHLKLPGYIDRVIYMLRFFPGVPIFFTISGFLIFYSYHRNPNNGKYFRNRFLRIFPGLWVCFIFTVLILICCGFLTYHNIFSGAFFVWIGTQVSFLQYYTPAFLRGFGVGTPNGSLWTIPVEVSFYVFVPVAFWLKKRLNVSENVMIAAFFVLSLSYNLFIRLHFLGHADEEPNLIKLLRLNLFPYLFYFLIGSAAYFNWDKIRRFYEGKGLWWLGAYIAYYLIASVWLKAYTPNYFPNTAGLIGTVMLSLTTLALAFTNNQLSNRLLKGNDVSYGMYLYHMPVINLFLFLDVSGIWSIFYLIIGAILLAMASWILVERPAISLKKESQKQY
jgi:peptidoglycan/LPS O-acetylase OafA/YrhL